MATKAQEHNKLMTSVGLTLLDVVPVAFPDHMLIKRLKQERDMLRSAFLQRFWRDNGPWTFWREMQAYNKTNLLCSCGDCFKKGDIPITVRTWDHLKHFMTQAGLTFLVVAEECEKDFNECAVQGKSKMLFSYPAHFKQCYPRPPDFNPLTACEHMAPVSHIDTHIVVQAWETSIGITYGRKLWGISEVQGNREVSRLDLLFARLRTSESSLQPL